jgi:hypothetical protein
MVKWEIRYMHVEDGMYMKLNLRYLYAYFLPDPSKWLCDV